MSAPHVTHHAVERYRERVAALDDAAIRRRLTCPAVRAAIAFGAPYVRLATGHRVALAGDRIVTVLPKAHDAGCCRKRERTPAAAWLEENDR